MIQTKIDGLHVTIYEMQANSYHRAIAEIAAQEAARMLKIPAPQIKFFDPGWRSSLKGFTPSVDEIWIAVGQRDLDVAKVAVHETRHSWQRRQPGWMARTEESRERDARIFEMSWPR